MSKSRWIQAATIMPPTIKVAGYKLLPFCIRHRVGLTAVKSPVLSIEKEITPNDLLLALRILSTHNLNDIRKPWTLREQFLLGYYNFHKINFIKAVSKLVTYFDAQSLWPKFWESDKKSKASCIPWELTVISGLTRNGINLEEAYTMPEADAVWLYFAHIRAEGAEIHIITDEEEKAMKEYEEYKRKLNEIAPKQKPSKPL